MRVRRGGLPPADAEARELGVCLAGSGSTAELPPGAHGQNALECGDSPVHAGAGELGGVFRVQHD